VLLAKEDLFLFCIIIFRIEEMGCGVAMTVLENKELINLEASNRASKSNVRTNNNLKASQSQPSIFRVRDAQNRMEREGQKENMITAPLKQAVIPKE
jgi:hypothetical protein